MAVTMSNNVVPVANLGCIPDHVVPHGVPGDPLNIKVDKHVVE